MPSMTKGSMSDSESLNEKVLTLLETYNVEKVMPDMELVGEGQKNEIRDVNGRPNRYYQWLACLARILKPRQVVELGAAAGISTIMIASELPKDSKFYSVDIDPTIAWKWMNKDYPQVVKILGDDLDMDIWKGVDLSKTDLWFIDSLHIYEQIKDELTSYKPYFKKGTVVVLDDIHLPDMGNIWKEIKYDKCDNTIPCHYSGFGFFIV